MNFPTQRQRPNAPVLSAPPAFLPAIPLCRHEKTVVTPNINAQRRVSKIAVVPSRTRIVPRMADTAPVAAQQGTELVSALLEAVKNSDFGLGVSAEKKENIGSIIEQLNIVGKNQTPMKDPRLFGKYSVVYTAQSTKQKSPPAGGLFRSRIGRLLFHTRGLYQHVLSPDVIVNMVCFRMLGIITGCVSLRGKLLPLEGHELGPNAITVAFEKPRLCFGRAIFQYGPKSTVRLATTYLDDRVRLAVGSRGSLFVFARDDASKSEMADEWEAMFKSRPLPTFLLPLGILSVVALTGFALWTVRVIAVIIAVMLAFVLKSGGTDIRSPDVGNN